MKELKKKIINEVDLLKENQNILKRVMAGMRRRIQVCLQRNGGHIDENGIWSRTPEKLGFHFFATTFY